MIKEIFKPIPGWEGLYSVSNYGNIYSYQSNRLIVGDVNNAGYERICLYNKNHNPKKQRFFRHRLVATMFVPNPNNLPVVNHIDLNRRNNFFLNLEWTTYLENERHSRVYGTKEYKPFIVVFANKTFNIFTVKSELARIINVSDPLVRDWLHGKSTTYLNYGIIGIKYLKDAIIESNCSIPKIFYPPGYINIKA